MLRGVVPLAAALGGVLVTLLGAVFMGQSYLWTAGAVLVMTLVVMFWPR